MLREGDGEREREMLREGDGEKEREREMGRERERDRNRERYIEGFRPEWSISAFCTFEKNGFESLELW